MLCEVLGRICSQEDIHGITAYCTMASNANCMFFSIYQRYYIDFKCISYIYKSFRW
jgi:hypothetical protein